MACVIYRVSLSLLNAKKHTHPHGDVFTNALIRAHVNTKTAAQADPTHTSRLSRASRCNPLAVASSFVRISMIVACLLDDRLPATDICAKMGGTWGKRTQRDNHQSASRDTPARNKRQEEFFERATRRGLLPRSAVRQENDATISQLRQGLATTVVNSRGSSRKFCLRAAALDLSRA